MRLRNTLLDCVESRTRHVDVLNPVRLIKVPLLALAIWALLATLPALSLEAEFEEGAHYHMIVPPIPVESGPDEVVVLELFWYGCPHCYNFERLLDDWKQNKADHVKFIRMPVALNRSWVPHARMYYALEKIGEEDRMHPLIFEAMHVQGRHLRDVTSMSRFLSQHGVDTEAFENAYGSSYVDEKMQHAGQFVRAAQASSVPTMVINGKYRSTASAAGGYDLLLRLTDDLVQREMN